MQPPPRKGKHSGIDLSSIHKKQLTKLQHKNQQEENLLEDIRLFSKQRSIIEKEYAQALCKLAQQFIAKRNFPPPSEDEQQRFKPIMLVWKTVLQETDRVGKVRIQAAETYMQQISEPAKPLKSAKQQVAKKVFEQITTLQKECAQSVHDLNATKKLYSTEEHLTHDASVKATDADNKVKNKSTGIFTSLATLQQKSAKLNNKLEACEVKSTSARNDYLLNLSAANAHLTRYYNTDLPELIKMLDGDMFDTVKEFFMTLSKTELECCGITQECFMKILSDSTMISRAYNLQCFMQENLVYTDTVQYKFEPQDSDSVTKVNPEHGSGEHLTKEAKKWATKIATESKAIREHTRQLQTLQEQSANGSLKPAEESKEATTPTTPMDPESKKDELRQIIRKAETEKVKAEARIDALRQGGVSVDEWLTAAQAEALVEEEEAETAVNTAASKKDHRSSTSVSIRSDSSGAPRSRTQSTTDPTESEMDSTSTYPMNSISSAPNDSTYHSYQQEDDDYGADETFVEAGHGHGSLSTGYSSGRNYPVSVSAIYDFGASNADELGLTENETIEIIADGDGDGWVKARNSAGETGFVPENYLHFGEETNGVDQNEMNVDQEAPASAGYTGSEQGSWGSAPASAGYETSSVSAGYDSAPQSAGYDSAGYGSVPQSAGYDSAGYGSVPQSAGYNATEASYDEQTPADGSGLGVTSAYSSTDYEVQDATGPSSQQQTVASWARALYDYDATCDEELSFHEGQLICILRKDENGIDDGWWKGQVDGNTGVFPSMVVDELEYEPVTNPADLASPDRPGPPAFTPPEPGPPPPSLEVTQPTPSDEGSPALQSHINGEAEPNTDNPKVVDQPDEASSDPSKTPDYTVSESSDADNQEHVITAEVHVDCDVKGYGKSDVQGESEETADITAEPTPDLQAAPDNSIPAISITSDEQNEANETSALNLDNIEFADDEYSESII